jgi:hypothetical protein
MSKAKKAAYAEKQRVAGVTEGPSLTPLAGGAAAAAPAKKHKAKKPSRGK